MARLVVCVAPSTGDEQSAAVRKSVETRRPEPESLAVGVHKRSFVEHEHCGGPDVSEAEEPDIGHFFANS